MNLLGVQFDIAWEDKPANFDKVRRLLGQASPPTKSLVVLPEMFATGFSMNTSVIAESYEGPTEQFLSRTAKEFGIFLLAGAAMLGRDGRARNKTLVFSPEGELLAFYAKQRPFTPGGEAESYAAGDHSVFFKWADITVSPFICYDLRFPELFRAAATRRPELYTVIASWPAKRINHWIKLLQARAIENQAYVIGVNRVGTDPSFEYSGRSLIVDPLGEIVADAGGREGVVRAQLDCATLQKYREGLPFLADMKPIRELQEERA